MILIDVMDSELSNIIGGVRLHVFDSWEVDLDTPFETLPLPGYSARAATLTKFTGNTLAVNIDWTVLGEAKNETRDGTLLESFPYMRYCTELFDSRLEAGIKLRFDVGGSNFLEMDGLSQGIKFRGVSEQPTNMTASMKITAGASLGLKDAILTIEQAYTQDDDRKKELDELLNNNGSAGNVTG